ncbi:hypothetical protein BJV82DRAFT_713558 [Fennellomyces sp. T-0311]|nr:hypothetical protein BJV82DRAFT_713558 [Fennellomyces sp. T-0311]
MTTIDQLITEARDAFAAGKLEIALHNSTNLIQELRQQTVNALELRASIYEKKANHTKELEDTLLIAEYDCNNTSAYLRAARIYSEQEKLYEALDYLRKALHTSPKKKIRVMIWNLLTKTKERLRRRVDFIAAAPYDIVCNILSHLGPHYASICMDVCHRWREVILGCPVIWENVDSYIPYWNERFDMVRTVSHHVRKLLLRYRGTTHFTSWSEFVKEVPFPRLQFLEVMDSSLSKDRSPLGEPFFAALHYVASTLTGVKIHGGPEVSLGKLLTTCPKLTSIDIQVENVSDWVTGMPTTTLLTNARIATNFPVDRSNLTPFFQCAPGLKKIVLRSLNWVDGVDISPLIEHCCPELSYIITGVCGHTCDFHLANSSGPSDGLKQMSLSNVNSTAPLLSRLERATDSLQALHIELRNDGHNSTWADWRPLSSFIMHKLTWLSIDVDPNFALYHHLPEMLRSYPALERLRLTVIGEWSSTATSVRDNVFAALANLENLHDLELANHPLDGEGFRKLIEKHARQESPTLKHLIISDCMIPINVLYDIVSIKSIESLLLYNDLFGRNSLADIDEFARLAAELPCLKYLYLDRSIQLTENAVRCIASSKSLERLVTNNSSLSEESYTLLKHLLGRSLARRF